MNITGKTYSLVVTANEVCLSAYDAKPHGGKRGIVAGISRGSQARMRRFLNSLIFDKFSFVTLTYRYNITDQKRTYKDLRLWHKNMCRKRGNACVIWKQELQKRGAIHYHLFCIDPPATWTEEAIRDDWMDATGQEGDQAARRYGTQTKTFDTVSSSQAGIICAYLAKYASKDGSATQGRAWGCLGRAYARQAEKRAEVSEFAAIAIFQLLEQRGVSQSTVDGGTVYSRFYCGHIGATSSGGSWDELRALVCSIQAMV